jgi:hypothetical protein
VAHRREDGPGRPGAALGALLVFGLALLAGCGSDLVPEGFEPAAASPGTDCPDLTGSYRFDDALLMKSLFDLSMPAGVAAPAYLSIARAPARGHQVVWHRDRTAFLAEVNDLARGDPDRYYEWRRLTLGEFGPSSQRPARASVAEIARHGPVFDLRRDLSLQRCEDRWAFAGSETRTLGLDMRSDDVRSEEHETWLSRNAAGDLLVRIKIYRLKYYTIYASAQSSIRFYDRSEWLRFDRAPAQDSQVPTAADLPPAIDPVRRARDCRITPERLVEFSQRIRAMLPRGAELSAFQPDPGYVAAPVTQSGCKPLVVDIGIVAASNAEIAHFMRAIAASDETFELVEMRKNTWGRYEARLRATLRRVESS